jgi:mono/diheme cytochrome c family protein
MLKLGSGMTIRSDDCGSASPKAPAALRTRWRFVLIGVICAGVSACAANPGPHSDTVNPPRAVENSPAALGSAGRAYAERACASCHAVAPRQSVSPDPKAPAFETIANTPGMTTMALNVWLHTPHRTMPGLIVNPDRIEDLSAYLQSLQANH